MRIGKKVHIFFADGMSRPTFRGHVVFGSRATPCVRFLKYPVVGECVHIQLPRIDGTSWRPESLDGIVIQVHQEATYGWRRFLRPLKYGKQYSIVLGPIPKKSGN